MAELQLYDCRRFMTLEGELGVFVPRGAESWMYRRIVVSARRDASMKPTNTGSRLGLRGG